MQVYALNFRRVCAHEMCLCSTTVEIIIKIFTKSNAVDRRRRQFENSGIDEYYLIIPVFDMVEIFRREIIIS